LIERPILTIGCGYAKKKEKSASVIYDCLNVL